MSFGMNIEGFIEYLDFEVKNLKEFERILKYPKEGEKKPVISLRFPMKLFPIMDKIDSRDIDNSNARIAFPDYFTWRHYCWQFHLHVHVETKASKFKLAPIKRSAHIT